MANALANRSFRASAVALLFVCSVRVTSNPAHSLQDQEADARAQVVRDLIDRGKFGDAEAQARRLLPAFDEGATDDAINLRDGDLLVEAVVRNGGGAAARIRELAERVIRIKTARFGATHPSLTPSLRNLGDVLFQCGEYQLAVARFRDALAVRERAGARPAEIADDLDHLARALTELGHYDEALALANRALAHREQTPASKENALARTLRVRGVVYQRKGQYREARADLERALTLLESSSPEHPDTAIALTLFGEQLSVEGDLLRAREILSRAVSLAGAVLPSAHPDMASSLGSLASNLQELGALAESRVLRQRALEIAESVFGSDHPMLAMRINDLANICLLQGEYVTARPLYERARGIYQQRLGPHHWGVTTASFNLGLVHTRLGDFREARREFEAVIATWERVLGRDHPNVARAVSALASSLADQGLDRDAQKYFARALSIRERALGPDHPYVAWTLGQRAESLARLARFPQALALASRAVQICESSGAQECLAGALDTHARILQSSGDDRGAARAFERSLAIALPLFGSSHPRIADTHIAFASVTARLHDRESAFVGALRGEASNRIHSRLTVAYLSERQALDYASRHKKGLDLSLSLMAGTDQASEVLKALVLARSLVLDELATRQRMHVQQQGALAPLWSKLASTRQRLANLVIRGPSEQRPEQYAALVDDARRAKEDAERQLAEQSAAFRSQLERTEIDLDRVRAALPSDSALVSFVRFNRTVVDEPSRATAASRSAPGTIPSYVAFVLRPDARDPEVVPLGRADALEALIGQWRRELVAGITRSSATSETERVFRNRGTTLRKTLWDPIAQHLSGTRRVYVVADGAINLVPLTALPVANSRYLLEDGPLIHYLSAERDLVAIEPESNQEPRGLLAIGGAAFADGSVFAAFSNKTQSTHVATQSGREGTTPSPTSVVPAASVSLRSAAARCRSLQSMRFEPLAGSRREVEEITNLWRELGQQNADGQTLIGRDASEPALKQLAPGKRILHLATHGFFLGDCTSAPDNTRAVGGLLGSARPSQTAARRPRSQELPENPLLLSGLAMAGANRRSAAGAEEDDGILTAEEVASLNLQGTEWAVLSACNTGLGAIKSGEGVFGLRRAFQIAGARTVIMSLWSVEDEATRMWMRALYDGRLNKRLNTADAVREASLTVLRHRRARGQSTHPFYWGAFVAAGDWR